MANDRMTEAARDVLLAEALGDLHKLQQGINELTASMAGLKIQIDGAALSEMVQVLDQKMNEFKHFQIPVVAAAKLQAYSETILRGMVAEIHRLVGEEVRQQAGRARWLVFIGIFCFGFASGVLARAFL